MVTTTSSPTTRQGPAHGAQRGWAFWLTALAGFTLGGLLRLWYFFLDDLTRLHPGTFGRRLLEESTGAYTALICFVGLVWLYDHLPLTRATWRWRWPAYTVGFVIFTGVHTSLMWATRLCLSPRVGLGPYDYGKFPTRFFMEAGEDAVTFIMLTVILVLVDTYRARQESEWRGRELEQHLIRAQLDALRLRLQPHFLFNALNTISQVMYEDPGRADEMIGHLADLLRQAIRTTDHQELPLAEELALLEHYVALMRARFGEDLELRVAATPEARQALVPSLLLQPLVENAVRHGNAARYGRGRVEVAARREGRSLRLEVTDDGDPRPEAVPPEPGAGLGLGSTAERLELLYGADHSLQAGPVDQGYRVTILIPHRPAPLAPFSATTEPAGPGTLPSLAST